MPARDPPGARPPRPQHPGGALAAPAAAPSRSLALLGPRSPSHGAGPEPILELGSPCHAGFTPMA